MRPRHGLPNPRLPQPGRPRPKTHPRRQNPVPPRGVEPPSPPHHLPKVSLHCLSRRVPHLPFRKKSSAAWLSGYSPLSSTHRSMLEVLELNALAQTSTSNQTTSNHHSADSNRRVNPSCCCYTSVPFPAPESPAGTRVCSD